MLRPEADSATRSENDDAINIQNVERKLLCIVQVVTVKIVRTTMRCSRVDGLRSFAKVIDKIKED